MANLFSLMMFGLSLFLLSTVFVRIFCTYAYKKGLCAIPNARSSHDAITPQGGGIVFVLLWSLSVWLAFEWDVVTTQELLALVPGTLLVSLCGFWDDHRGLPAKTRLIVQLLAGAFCLAPIGGVFSLHLLSCTALDLGWAGTALALLGLVWSTNLFNFMDGLDGIAAIEALFVFGGGGALFFLGGAQKAALLTGMLVLAVSGFLVWNWPKARVFMGDVGSYCLGFLVAVFSIVGDLWYNVPLVLWVILYGVFWFDATLTVIRRWCFGDNLAMAHREHAFQRLFRAGFSQTQVLFGVIGLNSILAMIAISTSFYPIFIKWGLLLAVILLTGVYLYIERLQPMRPNPLC